MRTIRTAGLTLPALLLGLSYSFTALAGTELINNGNFGTTTFPSTFNQSSSGWTSTSSTLTLKNQTTTYGCGQYSCYGGTADIWACSTSTSSAAQFSQENGIATLKPGTRYRISFNAFRDITSLSASDTTRAQNANLVVRVKSGGTANYAVKDILLSPMTFGSFTPGINGTNGFEFVTPVDTSPSGQPNLNQTKVAFSFDGGKGYNSGGICLSHVSLQEVDSLQSDNRVVVNTYGYPLQGKKVATWVLPANITNLTGYKWQVRYKGSFPTYTYGVGIAFYAVQTDASGTPVKDANGKYILQLDATNKPKVVGGTGTGGQNSWLTPNSGLLNSAIINADKDSGDRTVTLDFSDMGIQKSTAMSLPDLSGTATPSDYTDSNNVKWKILSGNSYNGGTGISGGGYSIRILDPNGAIVAISKEFSVLNAPFNSLKKDALFSLYHQRSGEAINSQYGIGDKAENAAQNHAAGHANETATCFTGVDLHGNDWGNGGSGCATIASSPKDVSGGWYDAADHGNYVVNGGVALWTLQNMVERLQKKGTLNTAFPAGGLSLPATLGSNNLPLTNLPDLLAEARKEMQWMMKMQIPSGYTMKVPVGNQANKQQSDADHPFGAGTTSNPGVYQVKVQPAYPILTPVYTTFFGRKFLAGYNITGYRKIEVPAASNVDGDIHYAGGTLPRLRIKLALTDEDVSGMVFHSVNDASWTGIPLDPSADTRLRKLMYPTTAATLNFAAVAAQCSRIWRGVDNTFADQCLAAAKTAWTAATRFAARGNILRYEYTNTSATADTSATGSWMTADSSNANADILRYGFALNPMFDGGGAYGDLRVGDEFLWASKELSLADTGGSYSTAGLLGDCTGSSLQCYSWISGFDWQNVSPLGYLSSWTANPIATNPDASKIIAAAVTFANYATPNSTAAQGYLFSKIPYSSADRNSHYDWGANGGVLNRSLILLAAHEANLSNIATSNLSYCRSFATTGGLAGGYINPNWLPAPDAAAQNKCLNGYKALDAAVNSLGYLLGRNTLEKSFISGYGSNDLSSAHHRWFAKPADVNYPRIPAGFVAGGPNTRDLPALRANASRYTFADMSKWLAAHPGATETDNTDWQVGDISDAGQQYLETQIVTKCTTGLENANTHWSIPAANQSGAVSYTPQKCYGDDYRSFATNEVAINWQTPLVWVTQYLSEIYQ